MASSGDNVSMALFCDFENVALGVRDTQHEKFDIKPVLERLLLKGNIVVKKAYCDWDRYKGFKATMHEANFELIEIPHVRQSGKNSADIRMVVDALDLCYTKSHVNTFVIISGDSDFSPLVSKLRENAKQVIGVGVKQSTSDLLVANCDEFIFYDDLVRESQRATARRQPRDNPSAQRRSPDEEKQRRDEMDMRRSQAIDMAVETFDALLAERGDSGKIWASVLKEAIKRRKPDFNETWYGFRAFGNLLEEAQARGLLEFGRDDRSGAYVFRSGAGSGGFAPDAAHGRGDAAALPQAESMELPSVAEPRPPQEANGEAPERREPRRRGRGGRGQARGTNDNVAGQNHQESAAQSDPSQPQGEWPDSERDAGAPGASIYMSRAQAAQTAARLEKEAVEAAGAVEPSASAEAPLPSAAEDVAEDATEAPPAAARKPPRARRPRKAPAT